MASAVFRDDECQRADLVDRWFRQLDQRRLDQGSREWLVQVTSILREDDVIWIQIADNSLWFGSVLMRVRESTSLEQAIGALASRRFDGWLSYPKVINVATAQLLDHP